MLADRGALRAEARGDVVGDGRDLGVGIDGAEGWHGEDVGRSDAPRAGNHDLRNIRGAGIIHRARTGECCESRNRAHSAPVMAARAGTLRSEEHTSELQSLTNLV